MLWFENEIKISLLIFLFVGKGLLSHMLPVLFIV